MPQRYLEHQVRLELREQEMIRREAGPDPMMLTYDGTVSTSGERRVIPQGGLGYAPLGAVAGSEHPTILFDGPIPINPSTGIPWSAMRVVAINQIGLTYATPNSINDPATLARQVSSNNAAGAYGSLLRLTVGSSYKGARTVREFVVAGSEEAAFQIGEYENARIELVYGTADTVVQWQWIDGQSGIAARTRLYTRNFTYTFAGSPRVPCPNGSRTLFIDTDALIVWQQTGFGGAGAGVLPRVIPFNTVPQPISPANGGVEVLAPYFQLGPPPGFPFATCNLFFELSQL